MKAVISCTEDEKYSWFIPLVTWAWNKLGVGVILFLPKSIKGDAKIQLGLNCMNYGYKENDYYYFDASKQKEATYAQCSRLFGTCIDLPDNEILITSDVDMAVFKIPPHENHVTIFGSDLVPNGQYPICYASATVKLWRDSMNLYYGEASADLDSLMNLKVKSYQQALDELLGDIECEHMRGNYWGKDQQTLWENTNDIATLIPRARPGTQFASNRVDREDINWRSYVNDELVDAHLWRPGYEENNFNNIMELLTMKFPDEDFTWLLEYNSAYKKLL